MLVCLGMFVCVISLHVRFCLGVVLEHIVPHTDSLLAVIMTAATNEVFR